jgi:hypothetical protein
MVLNASKKALQKCVFAAFQLFAGKRGLNNFGLHVFTA